MNHKRRRPKNRRGGCLFCKYWKINGIGKESKGFERYSDHRRRMAAKEDAKNVEEGVE